MKQIEGTKITEARLVTIAAWLNHFPEVKWDRGGAWDDHFNAFGWIGRDDGRYDFLHLTFDFEEAKDDEHPWIGMTTSSAKHSEEFYVRIAGAVDDHEPCVRLNEVFGKHLERKTTPHYEIVMVTCLSCPEGALYVPNVGPMGDSFHTTVSEAQASGKHWKAVDGGFLCASCRIGYDSEQ